MIFMVLLCCCYGNSGFSTKEDLAEELDFHLHLPGGSLTGLDG